MRSSYRLANGNVLSVGMVFILVSSLTVSLFFKEKWLWMDEILSYLLISDPSLAHVNDAIVSGLDANPPLFANLYWLIGHFISLNPFFLKAMSIVLFAFTVALFFRYITLLIGNAVTNFLLVTAVIGLTYLNFTLSTQIRGYALYLAISCVYFIVIHKLITAPAKKSLLVSHFLVGSLLALTHNFGLFYVAASGAFFGIWFIWSSKNTYLFVLLTHLLVGALWLFTWYASFKIQSDAGKPHSWIPLPTLISFFQTVGESIPTLSSKLERSGPLFFLPILRVAIMAGLFSYIAIRKIRAGFDEVIKDRALLFYLLSGFISFSIIFAALAVSFLHTSVFLSRYFWPNNLLITFQIVYIYYYFIKPGYSSTLVKLVPIYSTCLIAFLFYQNTKTTLFPSEILMHLHKVDKKYPLFFESADYFLPIWFYSKDLKISYLLDWNAANQEGNLLNGTTDYNILKSVNEKYKVTNIITTDQFNNTNFPHFYIVDESSRYQIEPYLLKKKIKVLHIIPVPIEGHQILECSF